MLTICTLILAFCIAGLSWQNHETNNNLFLIDKNMHIMDSNFQEQINYQVGQIRTHLLANGTIVDYSNVNGRYYPTNMHILIYGKSRSISSVHKTAIHEIGHYIYWEKMIRKERESWDNLTFDCYPSEYAEEDNGENFAESYYFWYMDNLTCEPQLSYFNNLSERIEIR